LTSKGDVPGGDLWKLHERIAAELTRKIALEKTKLEQRLRQVSLATGENAVGIRRFLPNITIRKTLETWAGRGNQTRWLAAELRSGKKLNHFLIRRST
jgi:DNA-binding protein H-NS